MKYRIYQTNSDNQGRIAEKEIEESDHNSALTKYFEEHQRVPDLTHVVVVEEQGERNSILYNIDEVINFKIPPQISTSEIESDKTDLENKSNFRVSRIIKPSMFGVLLVIALFQWNLGKHNNRAIEIKEDVYKEVRQANSAVQASQAFNEGSMLLQEILVKQNQEILQRQHFQLLLIGIIMLTVVPSRL